MVVVASGCYASAKRDHLFRRSALDFNCATSNLRYTDRDARTIDVEGCGKRGTYVETCDGDRYASGTTCTWALAGELASTEPRRVDGPPGAAP